MAGEIPYVRPQPKVGTPGLGSELRLNAQAHAKKCGNSLLQCVFWSPNTTNIIVKMPTPHLPFWKSILVKKSQTHINNP